MLKHIVARLNWQAPTRHVVSLVGRTTTSRTTPMVVRFFGTAAAAESKSKPDMFCFQCEQTSNGTGCTTIGVCGKTPETAKLQDLLVDQVKGISQYMHAAAGAGKVDKEINHFVLTALFSTLTNVNFDSARIEKYIHQSQAIKEKAKKLAGAAASGVVDASLKVQPWKSLAELEKQADKTGILDRRAKLGADVVGLQEMIMYGVKGTAAYADHAKELGAESQKVYDGIYSALSMISNSKASVNDLLGAALKVGETNLTTLGLLDGAHDTNFGTPTPATVSRKPKPGKAILVSGHDIKDTRKILQLAEQKGINVYTHGELLPAHAYPKLREFKNFAGHYGGPWQLQKFEFGEFPGAILMTSNCIVEPRNSYKSRIFTTHAVGWPGVTHVEEKDFGKVINKALELDGFTEDDVKDYADVSFTTGFGHKTVLSLADKVVSAVKSGAVKRFYVIGGCDGSEGERSYFTDVAKNTPKESIILTLGCGKYRFNHLNLGDIGGIPRILDMGQCNDSYSAIQVAVALANAFKTDVNSLPLSFAISWFEQKAVAVLLTLLHLGIRNIHLGPNVPGFATPTMLKILNEKFNLQATNNANPMADLALMNAGK